MTKETSDRRKAASRANGALSQGPLSPEGKRRSSRNALQHGFTAGCLLLDHESKENFEILMQNHIRRFRPEEGVELGLVEEMCAAYWRMHRIWAMEKTAINEQMKQERGPDACTVMTHACTTLADQPGTALLQRYETRLQNMYARAIRTFKVLKTIPLPDDYDDDPLPIDPPISELPNEPSPNIEHSPETAQPIDSVILSGAANPDCSRLSGGSPRLQTAAPTPVNPPAPNPAPPRSAKASGAAG